MQVEVSKFIGAAIQSASGIRGTVKKAIQPVAQDATPGYFRATFQDKNCRTAENLQTAVAAVFMTMTVAYLLQ